VNWPRQRYCLLSRLVLSAIEALEHAVAWHLTSRITGLYKRAKPACMGPVHALVSRSAIA
jgi:hypothetical protein